MPLMFIGIVVVRIGSLCVVTPSSIYTTAHRMTQLFINLPRTLCIIEWFEIDFERETAAVYMLRRRVPMPPSYATVYAIIGSLTERCLRDDDIEMIFTDVSKQRC